MNSSEHVLTGRRDEIDVIALVRVIWRYKFLVGFIALLCGLVAVYLALRATPIYRAEAIIIEAPDTSVGGAGSLSSQFGGLANLVGIGGMAGSSTGRQAQAILASHYLAEEFIRRQDLVAQLAPGSREKPSLWLAVKRFQENVLSITQEKIKGTTTVGIEWVDPSTAARWANGVVALANELMRARALADASRNIGYLKDQIAQTNMIELQHVMYTLIETETKKLMLAKGRGEYAFVVVDPAVAPEERIRPRRSLMVLTGGAFGVLLGTFAALGHNMWRRYRIKGTQQSELRTG